MVKSNFKDIQNELLGLYEKKNHDYGDSVHKTFETFGITSFLVRMSDKLNRAITLSKDTAMVAGESMRDTLMDLANYATIAVVELDNQEEGYNLCQSCTPPPKRSPFNNQ